jgi:hypothetical protein
MASPAGESNDEVLKLDFDRRLMLAILRLRSHVRCLIVGIPLTRMCRTTNFSRAGAGRLGSCWTA